MMKNKTVNLKGPSGVSVTTLVDNYIDLLLPSETPVERPKLMRGKARRGPLLAEHGLSLLIEVTDNKERHVIIMDFGISNIAVPNNIRELEIDPREIEAAFLSHGHHDHIGAIREVLSAIPGRVDLILHGDAFLQDRFHRLPDGKEVPIPSLKGEAVDLPNVSVVEVSEPTLMAGDHIATLTNIPRQTDFETGMPTAFYRKGGKLHKDNIKDDQALVFHIRNKGLVVLTGCGHSGIINTILYALEVTGIRDVFAVMGGFHLSGLHFEKIIDPTIQEMKKFSPRIIVPCHCTGWKAIGEFKKAFPESFVLNSVGTKINF
jgi:7,8-dihydropterin-6-yl-methyl-4-(beta-D-ribofuranosyl)aminobenzene 5'-phosphate synthase